MQRQWQGAFIQQFRHKGIVQAEFQALSAYIYILDKELYFLTGRKSGQGGRPTSQLKSINNAFETGLNLYKNAKLGHAGDYALHLLSGLVTLIRVFPHVGWLLRLIHKIHLFRADCPSTRLSVLSCNVFPPLL